MKFFKRGTSQFMQFLVCYFCTIISSFTRMGVILKYFVLLQAVKVILIHHISFNQLFSYYNRNIRYYIVNVEGIACKVLFTSLKQLKLTVRGFASCALY